MMRESVIYQDILQEGERKRLDQGFQRGRQEETLGDALPDFSELNNLGQWFQALND
ncbi:hypothetical protein L3556_03810 [Candidatus Synechococcus calcipolaris G9]|uniref:DUF4351 domain-containing protein n=1 Tax=Candidatus Synechococcus calcipolaris G9 TaxID=1497997 RepID=A0ABT6EWA1_9SYNE|nr:hypothetical protein [Candidatus Synechococcus calcipolaris]MDG2990062.1 hypothetical protein [Candidatus Synechococcus calcipolaris G9]